MIDRRRFFFTIHPGDLMRTRILPGADIMLVASAFWKPDKNRFKILRPPADHIGRLVIDSGGFNAAKKWGRYPWTHAQYCDWIRQEARDVTLAWAATLDYACERGVDRSSYRTNLQRIDATIENDLELRAAAPDIPWLSVLQGNTLEERATDIQQRRRLELIQPLMGVGSICGRREKEAAGVLRFYRDQIPLTKLHAFGLDSRTLDQPDAHTLTIESWDSYAWTFPRGNSGGRPTRPPKQPGESSSTFTLRLARNYFAHTIKPRLTPNPQLQLEVF